MLEKRKVFQQGFAEYETKVREAGKAYDAAKERYDVVLDESRDREVYEIESFLKSLEKREGALDEYDSGLMKRTLRQIKVRHDGRVVFEFFDGNEVTETM